MELITTDFLNSKNIPLKMVVSYEKDKLKINGDNTQNQLYVTFYSRRGKGDDYMIGRYYLKTLLEGKNRGLCLQSGDPYEYFVDDKDMSIFRAEYRIIKKVVNKLKGNK